LQPAPKIKNSMNQAQTTGVIATILFHVLLLLALFVWGFIVPYPPPPEEGVLINFGTLDAGTSIDVNPMQFNQPHTPPSVATPNATADDDVLTQDEYEAPVITKKGRKRKQQQEVVDVPNTQQEQVKEPPRTVNADALFRGQSAGTDKSIQGNGADGVSMNSAGSPDATTSSNMQAQGYTNDRSMATLSGRTLVGKLPAPDYDVQMAGRVVVKIKVDRSGNVLKAEAQQKGSTVIHATLYAAAEKAAMRAKFTPAPDDAPAQQNGTIVYLFKMGRR